LVVDYASRLKYCITVYLKNQVFFVNALYLLVFLIFQSKPYSDRIFQKFILGIVIGKILKALDKSGEAWYDNINNVDGNK